jgi:hypothetical protein
LALLLARAKAMPVQTIAPKSVKALEEGVKKVVRSNAVVEQI